MRHLGLVAVIAAATLTGGCLSVARLCKCVTEPHTEYRTEWSEEAGSNVVVAVHCGGGEDPFAPFGLMPTLGMRWCFLKMSLGWIPPTDNWAQRRIGMLCATLALTPGLIVDIPVDLLSIPWDWKYRGGVGKDPYAREQEERRLRSVCTFCGKTNDAGRFGLCIQSPALCEQEAAERFGTQHGCCPACVKAAKEKGYLFR